jgi:hypothetical protein
VGVISIREKIDRRYNMNGLEIILYFAGLVMCAVSVGDMTNTSYGFLVLGAGMILCPLLDRLLQKIR